MTTPILKFFPKVNRPKVGQVWAFGDESGRRVTITRVSRGLAGSWELTNPPRHLSGPRARVYVHAFPACQTQTVKSFLSNFVFIK